jgi:hypothetical protein
VSDRTLTVMLTDEEYQSIRAQVATSLSQAEVRTAARYLPGAVGNQYCLDHKIAWTDGGDCWGAGINGIDACRITTTALLVVPLDAEEVSGE